jgi:hypothetical protein
MARLEPLWGAIICNFCYNCTPRLVTFSRQNQKVIFFKVGRVAHIYICEG